MTQSTVEYPKRVVVDLTEKAPIRVLHVDDEAGFLKAAKPCLEMQGIFQVDTASCVEEAMEKMKEKEFDVIVSDYIMPGKDGLEFLKELRNSGNNIPFIIFTGRGREIVAIRALNLGADQYVNKIGPPEVVYSELAHGIRKVMKAKQAEEALRESEEKYRKLVENVGVPGTYFDVNGEVLLMNTVAAQALGGKPEDFVGKKLSDLFPVDMADKYLKRFRDIARTGRGGEFEDLVELPSGNQWFGSNIQPVTDIDGNIFAVQVISYNITERKEAEKEIETSKKKLETYIESMIDGVVISDLRGRTIDINEACLKLLGYKRKEDVVGKSAFIQSVPKKQLPKVFGILKEIVRKGFVRNREITVLTKDRKEIPIMFSATLMKNAEGRPTSIFTIFRDITEQKKAEESLKTSQGKFRNIFENVNDCMIYLDRSGRILDVNRRAVEVFGGSRKEVLGKHFTKVGIFSLRDVPTLMRNFAKILAGKQPPLDINIKNKKGQEMSLECSASLMKTDDKLTGIMVVARDITERKKILRKLKTINEKLGVVGKLTRHDARNKLSGVTMNVFLAKQKLPGDHEALKHLSEIESACGEVERIFDFARIYEKIGMEELAYMDVEKTLEESVMLFSDLHDVKVTNDCRGLTVLADSLQRQLFHNLIDNSLKHGEKVSQIRVHYKEVGKNQLKLVYEDDGVGIPKAEKEKIFKEGYGEGSGYGLYLIRKMCEVYGWTIRETGKQGKGAQFTITIPKMGKKGRENYRLLKNFNS